MSRSHIFLSHVCKIFVVHKNSCGCRGFFKTFFLERLFVNPPLWQRWLTSVLPMGYFYLLGWSFVLQGWWNHLKEERETSLLEQTPTFCYRFCLRQSFFFPRSLLLIPLYLSARVRVWCTLWQTWRKCTFGWWSTSLSIRCSHLSQWKNW